MEQQKILWIIFSVALFVLVIVGVGVIWFLPSNHATVAQATTPQTGNKGKISFDPYEWAQSQNSNYPGLDSTQNGQSSSQGQGGGNFTIIYGQQPGSAQPSAVSGEPSVTVSPSSSGAAVAAPAPPAPRKPAPSPPPAPRRRTVAPSPAPSRAAPTPAPAPSRAVTSHRPETRRVVQHWIQVAAYTSDFRAQRAKKALQTNGIAGKIMSRDINGRTFFRVRVGPYESQQEAEKFLTEIKKINEFKNSYISLVYATQSAN